MLKPSLLIHVLAAFAVVSGVIKLREDALKFRTGHNLAAIRAEPEPPVATIPLTAPKALPQQDWTEIASRDPFSFDRSDIPIVMTVETPLGPPKPKSPKPLLFGTMMIGDNRIALLGPGNAAGRGSRPMRLGEEMEGWKLIQIDDKSVLVQENAVQETLVINDPTALVPRDHSKTLINAPPPPPPVASSSVTSEPAKVEVPTGTRDVPAASKRTRVIQTPFGSKVIEDSQ